MNKLTKELAFESKHPPPTKASDSSTPSGGSHIESVNGPTPSKIYFYSAITRIRNVSN